MEDRRGREDRQVHAQLSQQLREYWGTLPTQLDERIDERLVRTFTSLLNSLTCRSHDSLMLTSLAPKVFARLAVPAAVKRLSNLLRSPKWSASLLHDALWSRAQHLAFEAAQRQLPLLMLWDESVWEKPETLTDPNLGSVRSAKAKRLNRLRPGFFHPPHANTHVPGLRWAMWVLATPTTSHIAGAHFWSNRDAEALPLATQRRVMLAKTCAQFGRQLIHVFDRGYVGLPTIRDLLEHRARFIMRWKSKGAHLQREDSLAKDVYKLFAGKRAMGALEWVDHDGCKCSSTVRFLPVKHPHRQEQLWCVMSKRAGHKAMYLLTNEPVTNLEQARAVILAYMRRWEIERRFRHLKTLMSIETIQLRDAHARDKLMAMLLLASNASLHLLQDLTVVGFLLRRFNHRTGAKLRRARAPLQRFLDALERFASLSSEHTWATPIYSG